MAESPTTFPLPAHCVVEFESGSDDALIAFAVGYGVIVAFLKLVSSRSYLPFVLYRLILASCLFALLATGRIAPMS